MMIWYTSESYFKANWYYCSCYFSLLQLTVEESGPIISRCKFAFTPPCVPKIVEHKYAVDPQKWGLYYFCELCADKKDCGNQESYFKAKVLII